MHVERISSNDWLVTIVSDEEPEQVTIDPDGVVMDSDPYNNLWKPEWSARISPFYTPVDEASLMQPWQKHGVVAGFGIDGDGRIGLRGAFISSDRYRISPFVAYTAATASRNTDHLSAGIDAIVYNMPSANWQLLARYEYALLSTVANDPGHQARIALRKVLNYSTSMIYPNLSYIDLYTRFGDNFFPDEDNTISLDPRIEQYDNVRAFGVDFHADSQMPYWDPDRGFRVDANFEQGVKAFSGGADYGRVSGQMGVVQRLCCADGWLAETKIAGRLAGGYGWSDNGEHFRFGGPGRFRGRNATQTEGNAFWLSSLEWRFPGCWRHRLRSPGQHRCSDIRGRCVVLRRGSFVPDGSGPGKSGSCSRCGALFSDPAAEFCGKPDRSYGVRLFGHQRNRRILVRPLSSFLITAPRAATDRSWVAQPDESETGRCHSPQRQFSHTDV